MRIDNRKQALKFKRIFFIISIFIALTALVLFWLDHTFQALITVAVFSVWYLYFHVADYQFIIFSNENGRIILRFYKAIAFGKPAYHSIDFPQEMLRDAKFENSVFGKLSDITLTVKTNRGIAEYDTVSLSAVPFADRIKIQETLQNIIYH